MPDPTFPPLLSGHAVDASSAPFDVACRAARSGDAGAGDVFWSRSTDRTAVAIVLEPEVELNQALAMHFVSMVAFGDAFGALGPPELGMFYHWPGSFMVNAADVGIARFAIPTDTADDVVPDWMVVAVEIVMRKASRGKEPGHDLDRTTLEEEGCGDLQPTELIESYCRHFLVWVHTWQEDGFGPVHDMWTGRMSGRNESVSIAHDGSEITGNLLGLDEHGNLLLKRDDGDTVAVPVSSKAERIS